MLFDLGDKRDMHIALFLIRISGNGYRVLMNLFVCLGAVSLRLQGYHRTAEWEGQLFVNRVVNRCLRESLASWDGYSKFRRALSLLLGQC